MTTADAVRLEVHLMFNLGQEHFEIDISKKDIALATKLCCALLEISDKQMRLGQDLARVDRAMEVSMNVVAGRLAATTLSGAAPAADANDASAQPGALVTASATAVLKWLQTEQLARQADVDVGTILRRYLGA